MSDVRTFSTLRRATQSLSGGPNVELHFHSKRSSRRTTWCRLAYLYCHSSSYGLRLMRSQLCPDKACTGSPGMIDRCICTRGAESWLPVILRHCGRCHSGLYRKREWLASCSNGVPDIDLPTAKELFVTKAAYAPRSCRLLLLWLESPDHPCTSIPPALCSTIRTPKHRLPFSLSSLRVLNRSHELTKSIPGFGWAVRMHYYTKF